MLDKSIPYHRMILKREPGAAVPDVELPSGYTLVLYQPGDELAWAEIETSVLEFMDTEAALTYFQKEFAPHAEELRRRMLFVRDETGNKVATFTAWWNFTDGSRHPYMHWVAVKPEVQGLGIGKALVAQGVQHMVELEGDVAMYLSTQTWSHKAIRLYRWAGFDFVEDEIQHGGAKHQTREGIEVIRTLI